MRSYFVGLGTPTKPAFLWIAIMNGGFFGADLFFSNAKEFKRLRGKESSEDLLLPVLVPIDFDDWNYIPDCY